MYYVYKVTFENHNAVYVGCTNNLRRRKDQHNGNARTGKSFFGRFMAGAGITLSLDDMKVIGEFHDRPDALKMERDETLALHGKGLLILNDNYSDHCSRNGMKGSDNPASKRYVLVDIVSHVAEPVDDVHEWCSEHQGVNYKTIIGTSVMKPYLHRNRYLLRHADEWDEMSDKERDDLVSGAWYAQLRANHEQGRRETISKRYRVVEPDGTETIVRNLDKYAREHGVNAGNLHASLANGRPAAGYRVIERLS